MGIQQSALLGGHPEGFAATARTDRWWVGAAATLVVLSAFSVYATWAALQGQHYYASPYLSPFYSPVLFTWLEAPGAAPLWHAWFGTWPAWWPDRVPASPAFLILMFPGAFRFTCYYYRKAYYRAFAGSPPGCAVVPFAKGRREYKGETGLLLFQNLHRYALYFALVFVVVLYYDAYQGFFRDGVFGVGVGSVILLLNATLLAGYTLGCHSLRHLVGGRDDCMSCGEATVKLRLWKAGTWLNIRHARFAWVSLFVVGLTDAYVRMVSMGILVDLNTWD
jgi:hypothetical protein